VSDDSDINNIFNKKAKGPEATYIAVQLITGLCRAGHGAWLGWTDGCARARQAQAASGELRAEIDGSGGGGGGVAYEARGYKQRWADERAVRRASRQPNRATRDFGSCTL